MSGPLCARKLHGEDHPGAALQPRRDGVFDTRNAEAEALRLVRACRLLRRRVRADAAGDLLLRRRGFLRLPRLFDAESARLAADRAGRAAFPRAQRVLSPPRGAKTAHGVRGGTASGGCGRLFSGFTGGAIFAVTPQLSLRGHSSSQAPYPSPRRKRQVSSIALLVLSKQQTLRWFAVWSRFCLARKKYAKKRRWGTK